MIYEVQKQRRDIFSTIQISIRKPNKLLLWNMYGSAIKLETMKNPNVSVGVPFLKYISNMQ